MPLPSGFVPSAMQVGHAIGFAISSLLIEELARAPDAKQLLAAGISRAQYTDELVLLSSAAAMHAIESAGLSPKDENAAAAGLYSWLRERTEPGRTFSLHSIEDTLANYAAASRAEAEAGPSGSTLSALEEEFGERLLELGENNKVRGEACVLLCLVAPRILWPSQYKTAMIMLREAGLVKVAQ